MEIIKYTFKIHKIYIISKIIMNETDNWKRFFETNKDIKAIAQKVLLKDKFNFTTDGVDFVITHFQKIGEILDKQSIEYISFVTAILKNILEQTTVDNLPFLSQSLDQTVLEDLKAIYIFKCIMLLTNTV